MPANVETEAVQFDRAADATDIDGVFFDHRHAIALLGQQIGSGQSGRASADDGDVHMLVGTRHGRLFPRWSFVASGVKEIF